MVVVRGPGRDAPFMPLTRRIGTFNLTAICRLVLLAVLVMLYLTWPIERHPNLADRLIALRQPLPHEPDFLLHRLLTGLTEATTAAAHAGRVLP